MFVEVQKFHNKAHSIKKNKEGPICATRRIDIKALCMFKLPAKKAIKKSRKIQWKNWVGTPRGCQSLGILGTCSTVGLKQLKRSTTKYKKWRTNMFLSSTQWCSKESESLESDNSWTKAGTSGNPEWRTIKGSGWENLQPSRNGFLSSGKNGSKERQPKAKSKR